MSGRNRAPRLLLALVALATVAGLVAVVAPGTAETIAIPVISGAALLFTLLHAPRQVGWRAALTYLALAYGISFALEASSVATGFPFGYYTHHTGGPAVAGIPLVVPLGYVAYGWIAWVLACAILRPSRRSTEGTDLFSTPLVATCILTGWDFTYDAIYATVDGRYTYRHPGGFFGVPVTNYLGWLLTGWLILQCFALVERRLGMQTNLDSRVQQLLPGWLWAVAVLPVIGQAIQNSSKIIELGGRQYREGDLYGASAVAGLLTLLFVAVLATARILRSEECES